MDPNIKELFVEGIKIWTEETNYYKEELKKSFKIIDELINLLDEDDGNMHKYSEILETVRGKFREKRMTFKRTRVDFENDVDDHEEYLIKKPEKL